MTRTRPAWQLTDQDRRRALAAVLAVTTGFFGRPAPLVRWGFDYLYDRRDLIFATSGTPIQAMATDRSVLPLSALHGIMAPRHATLSINTRLTDSARRAGLRSGDPVGLLVAGGTAGLVVPTRIGERMKITVPSGTYSVTAFGSRLESLFTVPAPYRVAAGRTATLRGGSRALALPLAREPLLTESDDLRRGVA